MIRLALIKIVFRILRRLKHPSDIRVIRKNFDLIGQSFLFCGDMGYTQVSAGGVPAEWVNAEAEISKRYILYLHGGAFASGSPKAYRGLAGRIAVQAEARALVIAYRLFPEHPFPAALEDSVTSYEWLLSQGLHPHEIAVIGDSAGGGLAVSLMLALKDRKIPLPACLVCISPWVDLSCSSPSFQTNATRDPLLLPESCIERGRAYSGGVDLRHPYVSPVFGDLSGLPPLLIQAGEDEVLVDDARRLAERARTAGTPVDIQIWKDMFHVWHYFARYLPEGRQAIDRIADFLFSQIPPRMQK